MAFKSSASRTYRLTFDVLEDASANIFFDGFIFLPDAGFLGVFLLSPIAIFPLSIRKLAQVRLQELSTVRKAQG